MANFSITHFVRVLTGYIGTDWCCFAAIVVAFYDIAARNFSTHDQNGAGRMGYLWAHFLFIRTVLQVRHNGHLVTFCMYV